eukprot:1157143-Pelagomonas_calceolata.AAC.6
MQSLLPPFTGAARGMRFYGQTNFSQRLPSLLSPLITALPAHVWVKEGAVQEHAHLNKRQNTLEGQGTLEQASEHIGGSRHT